MAALADEVGLGRERLSSSVHSLSAADRVRVHLARALAVSPQILILEHVTAPLVAEEASHLGQSLATIADDRGLAWIALTEDDAFVSALGGTVLALEPGTGDLKPPTQGWTSW